MIALVLALALAGQVDPAIAAAPPSAPLLAGSESRLAIGLDEHVGGDVPRELTFTDTTGRRVALAAYLDRGPVVLVLAYSRCRLLCSVVLRGLTEAMRASRHVPGRDFVPVIVSLDPGETTDEAARRQSTLLAQVGRSGDRAAWPYLVGDDTSIHRLAEALGFRYAWDDRTQQFAHPAVVFVLTRDGRIAEYVRGVVYEALDDAIDRASRSELTTSTARDLLRCFHDDPARSRYEARLQLAFRIGAAIIFCALVALIAGLVGWERRRGRRR
jgi:protein SCO1/2